MAYRTTPRSVVDAHTTDIDTQHFHWEEVGDINPPGTNPQWPYLRALCHFFRSVTLGLIQSQPHGFKALLVSEGSVPSDGLLDFTDENLDRTALGTFDTMEEAQEALKARVGISDVFPHIPALTLEAVRAASSKNPPSWFNVCENCLKPEDADESICKHCGHDPYNVAPGTRYTITDGQGNVRSDYWVFNGNDMVLVSPVAN